MLPYLKSHEILGNFASLINDSSHLLETPVPSGDCDDEAGALFDPRIAHVLKLGDDVEQRTVGAELSSKYL